MPVELPNLFNSRLSSFQFCIWLPKDTLGLAEAIGADGSNRIESKYGDADTECYVQLLLSRFKDEDFHWHVNVARSSIFVDDPPRDLVSLSVILQKLDLIMGKTGAGWYRGRFAVPIGEVPPDGVIANLAGVAMDVSGHSLTIKGATLAFNEDDEFSDLQWTVSAEYARGYLGADIRDKILSTQYLVDGMEHVDFGIGRFVLERDAPNDDT